MVQMTRPSLLATQKIGWMPRRIVRAAALSTLLALALAGCVGIPSGGPVNVGPLVQAGGGSSFADLPSGPAKNASKQTILTGFMQAANLPENDYATAKLFLTAKAEQNWIPTKSVLIREGSAETFPEPDGSLSYSVSTKASVGADGTYAEQSTVSTQNLNYGFQRVHGQWRISALADETVVSRNSFDQVFGQYPVYFFDPGFQFLVPDVRWFPTGASAPTRIVSALLAGPAGWLGQGSVVSAFPQGVQVGQAVTVHANSATVDLSATAADTQNLQRARMLQQLQESLQAVDLTTVTMTAHGAPLTVPSPQASRATVAVAVDSAPLIQRGKQFGFFPRLESLGKISAAVVALDGSAATLNHAQTAAAVLTSGGVYLVTGGTSPPLLVDSEPGLIAPSIDPDNYVWTVPATNPSAIRAESTDGVVHMIASALPSSSTIVSLDVSRDGTRLLVYLKTDSGPRLIVAGIIRRAGVPTSLGPLLDLPVSSADPIDATWVDPSTVAALGRVGDEDTVISYVIGGSETDASTTTDAVHLVGGSDADSLRLITAAGEVQQLRSSGWQNIGIVASILATQQ
jgi:hypothetical protein